MYRSRRKMDRHLPLDVRLLISTLLTLGVLVLIYAAAVLLLLKVGLPLFVVLPAALLLLVMQYSISLRFLVRSTGIAECFQPRDSRSPALEMHVAGEGSLPDRENAVAAEVARLAAEIRLRTPLVLVHHSMAPNAMAQERPFGAGVVIITKGLLTMDLTEQELRSILAHELSHLARRDGPAMVLARGFNLLGVDAAMALSGMSTLSGAPTPTGWGVIRGGVGLFQVILWLITLPLALVLVLASIVASLPLMLLLCRSREFAADRGAVAITQDRQALISAIRKIAGGPVHPSPPSDIQTLSAAFPLLFAPVRGTGGRSGWDRFILENVRNPASAERVRRLER